MADRLRERMQSAFVMLGAIVEERPQLLALATDDVVERGLRADNVVKVTGAMINGGGGGRPGLAQAGGRDGSQLDEALAAAHQMARDHLDQD
jgi:alanyl-tRNA synthetase